MISNDIKSKNVVTKKILQENSYILNTYISLIYSR